jgi:serine/threonine protein kinase
LSVSSLAGEKIAVPETTAGSGGVSQKTQPTLGRYEIIEQIGKGAMGIVYKGRDPKLQRLTAIKTIRFIDDYDEDKVEKVKAYFYHEAEVVARLSHKNIVKIYDVGEDLDLSYLAMEYLEGQSLDAYCQAEKRLSIPQIVGITAQVCDALDYAHNHGIIHRDIKPGNIMVLNSGEVKVTDFGIARAAGSTKTRTGVIKGTPYYMSPEQARGKKLDGRADIFSLGVVLYHALTGKLPFTGENLAAIMYQTANADPTPASVYNTEIVQPIVDLLDRALAKDPQLRFQSAAQMAEALRSLQFDVTAETKIKPTVDAATDSGTAEVDAKALPIGDNVPAGDEQKEELNFSDMDQAINLETRARMQDRSDSTLVIQQGPADLPAAQDDATRKIDMSDLSASQTGPSEAPSYQVVKTILPPGDGNDKPATTPALERQAGSRIRTRLTKRFAVYLVSGILLLGVAGAAYFMLWERSEPVDQKNMLAEQQALVRKIMQEKMQEKQRLANEKVQEQQAAQEKQAEETRKQAEQKQIVQQKLEDARKKQEAERLARLEAEKKKEQERLEAIRIEKEKERARLAAEEAARQAEAKRIAEAEREKKAALKQQDIRTVEKHIQTAEMHRQEKRFLEAKQGYEEALAHIRNSRFQNDNALKAYRKKIETALAADDIAYGSKGYVEYNGEWLTPEEMELKRYSEGFVKYKGTFRDHKTLKNTINKLCDPLVQKYLAQKYSGKTVHSKNVYFKKVVLTRNNADYSQYSVYYRWSVSTFKGMDEDICTLDIKYTAGTDKWSLLKGCE